MLCRVNLKSASFIVIMHLHEGLTHIQSQIKPWLLFGESFTLRRMYCGSGAHTTAQHCRH